MLKTLLKKQMMELWKTFFVNQKKGTKRSKASTTLCIVGYALLMVGVLGGMFGFLAKQLCKPLVTAGVGWLYFTIMSMIALALGVFGSVFNTFSGLYMSKDNDLLLSMPIPPGYILLSRVLGAYLLGVMFSAVVIVPAVIVYFIEIPLDASAVFGNIWLVFLLSVLVLILTCFFGWVIAKISKKLKNKSFITVAAALLFLVLYYIVYYKAAALIGSVIQNAVLYGKRIRGAAYPLYLFGQVGTGDWMAILLTTLVTAVLLAGTYRIMSKSFLGIATATGKVTKVQYREKKIRMKSVSGALFAKELRRFTASPNYMLNCGLGMVFLPVAGIFLLIKGSWIREMSTMLLGGKEDLLAVILVLGGATLSAMNDMAAPSVSLEGKMIWIAQSLPITSWQALKAKLQLQILMTSVPVLFCSICALIVFRPSLVYGIFLLVMPLLFTLFFACMDLTLNLRHPNLEWTNEIYPIKQGLSVTVALLGSWGLIVVMGISYYLLYEYIGGLTYLVGLAILILVLTLLLFGWLKKKGTVIFETL